MQNEEELSDFTVEIEILHDLNHENIIQLLDAYFYDNKLWVSGVAVEGIIYD